MNMIIKRLKQICSEMKTIMNKADHNGQQLNEEEQDLLEQLAYERDELVIELVFH